MDFIYSRLNNNLVDINRLESITLLKCEQENIPLEGLNIGDYYLKFTVVDSDKINYCDLSQLNDDEKSAADALYEEQQRAIARENTIENNSGNYLDIEQEENTGIVTIKLLNIHGSVLDTKTLDLETEKIIRNITLDQENKSLIFSLVDSTTITCDISDLINDYNAKINNLTIHTNEEINRLDLRLDDEIARANQAEQNITDKLNEEINRAQNAEQKLTTDLNQEISDRQEAVTNEQVRAEQVENTLKTNLENEIQNRINSDKTITENINNILNNKLTIRGEKTFAQTMIVGEDYSQNIKIGITKDDIYCIKSPGVYTTTLNSESGTIDSHNTIYDLTNSGIITNVTDPVNGRDVTHKNYVDNSLKSVSDTLSADISSEASRATEAESALKDVINSEIESRTQSDTNLSNRLDTVETLVSPKGSNQTLAGLVFEEI